MRTRGRKRAALALGESERDAKRPATEAPEDSNATDEASAAPKGPPPMSLTRRTTFRKFLAVPLRDERRLGAAQRGVDRVLKRLHRDRVLAHLNAHQSLAEKSHNTVRELKQFLETGTPPNQPASEEMDVDLQTIFHEAFNAVEGNSIGRTAIKAVLVYEEQRAASNAELHMRNATPRQLRPLVRAQLRRILPQCNDRGSIISSWTPLIVRATCMATFTWRGSHNEWKFPPPAPKRRRPPDHDENGGNQSDDENDVHEEDTSEGGAQEESEEVERGNGIEEEEEGGKEDDHVDEGGGEDEAWEPDEQAAEKGGSTEPLPLWKMARILVDICLNHEQNLTHQDTFQRVTEETGMRLGGVNGRWGTKTVKQQGKRRKVKVWHPWEEGATVDADRWETTWLPVARLTHRLINIARMTVPEVARASGDRPKPLPMRIHESGRDAARLVLWHSFLQRMCAEEEADRLGNLPPSPPRVRAPKRLRPRRRQKKRRKQKGDVTAFSLLPVPELGKAEFHRFDSIGIEALKAAVTQELKLQGEPGISHCGHKFTLIPDTDDDSDAGVGPDPAPFHIQLAVDGEVATQLDSARCRVVHRPNKRFYLMALKPEHFHLLNEKEVTQSLPDDPGATFMGRVWSLQLQRHVIEQPAWWEPLFELRRRHKKLLEEGLWCQSLQTDGVQVHLHFSATKKFNKKTIAAMGMTKDDIAAKYERTEPRRARAREDPWRDASNKVAKARIRKKKPDVTDDDEGGGGVTCDSRRLGDALQECQSKQEVERYFQRQGALVSVDPGAKDIITALRFRLQGTDLPNRLADAWGAGAGGDMTPAAWSNLLADEGSGINLHEVFQNSWSWSALHVQEHTRLRKSLHREKKHRQKLQMDSKVFRQLPSLRVLDRNDTETLAQKIHRYRDIAQNNMALILEYAFGGRACLRYARALRDSKRRSHIYRTVQEFLNWARHGLGEEVPILIAYGDAVFPGGTAGSPPGPHREILRELHRQPNVTLVLTDEFRTSQRHWKCGEKLKEMEDHEAAKVAKNEFGDPVHPQRTSVRWERWLRRQRIKGEKKSVGNEMVGWEIWQPKWRPRAHYSAEERRQARRVAQKFEKDEEARQQEEQVAAGSGSASSNGDTPAQQPKRGNAGNAGTRVFHCEKPCCSNGRIDRDINAAMNILLQMLTIAVTGRKRDGFERPWEVKKRRTRTDG